ncbi:MAG TPA: type II secretion system protein [Polyangiaceae bacterium]|nr:type II secretion system protein [Polyangiaceae bacterium]
MGLTANPGAWTGLNENEEAMKQELSVSVINHVLVARRRRLKRRLERGVTLFEVLIVVAILAMIAGGVAFFALPQFNKAKVNTAEGAARVIRQAASQWQATNNETSCPTMSQLVQDKLLDPGQNTADPWGQPFSITCGDEDVMVVSGGPDKKKGTKDDIVIPKGATGPGE